MLPHERFKIVGDADDPNNAHHHHHKEFEALSITKEEAQSANGKAGPD